MHRILQLKMLNSTWLIVVLFILSGCNFDYQRDQIRIVGSSTVYPFVTVAAEQFGWKGEFKTPVVEATGTGGGFHLFCSGTGYNFADIINASRSIKKDELTFCKSRGIQSPEEIILGYDGITLVSNKNSDSFRLSKKHLFLALATVVPKNGKLVPNYFTKWNEIDSSLPDYKISVYGPSTTSGTRESFEELVMQDTCNKIREFKEAYPDHIYRKMICAQIRADGGYIEIGENDNLVIQKVVSDKQALGILGFNFLMQNLDRIKPARIDEVFPNIDTIASNRYPLSRPLYVYVKKEHYGFIPGLTEFVTGLTSSDAVGKDGYLTNKGLITKKKIK